MEGWVRPQPVRVFASVCRSYGGCDRLLTVVLHEFIVSLRVYSLHSSARRDNTVTCAALPVLMTKNWGAPVLSVGHPSFLLCLCGVVLVVSSSGVLGEM